MLKTINTFLFGTPNPDHRPHRNRTRDGRYLYGLKFTEAELREIYNAMTIAPEAHSRGLIQRLSAKLDAAAAERKYLAGVRKTVSENMKSSQSENRR